MKFVIARWALGIEGVLIKLEWIQLGAFIRLEEVVMQLMKYRRKSNDNDGDLQTMR